MFLSMSDLVPENLAGNSMRPRDISMLRCRLARSDISSINNWPSYHSSSIVLFFQVAVGQTVSTGASGLRRFAGWTDESRRPFSSAAIGGFTSTPQTLDICTLGLS